MSISRVKPAGWTTGEILTSTQQNQLDTNVTYAVDGRDPGLEIVSRSVTRSCFIPMVPDSASNWVAGGTIESCFETSVSTAAKGYFYLRVPSAATITSFSVWIRGASHASLPGNMPSIQMYSLAVSAGSFTLSSIGTAAIDSSANISAYDACHVITKSGLSTVVDNTGSTRYFFLLTSESGSNAVAAMQVLHASVTYTIARLDED